MPSRMCLQQVKHVIFRRRIGRLFLAEFLIGGFSCTTQPSYGDLMLRLPCYLGGAERLLHSVNLRSMLLRMCILRYINNKKDHVELRILIHSHHILLHIHHHRHRRHHHPSNSSHPRHRRQQQLRHHKTRPRNSHSRPAQRMHS